MRAKDFVTEQKKGLRGNPRGDADDSFTASHPGIVAPAGRGDLYIGRYYDFYRVASLAGMDPEDLDEVEDINFFGNLPVFSAYTEVEREKLVRAMKKLKMNPEDWIPNGSTEKNDTNCTSPVKAFKGYKK
jgi:hypothetical protein